MTLTGPSPHLAWSELACHDASRTPYPEAWRDSRAIDLGELFEAYRVLCGNVPLTILSGYRTSAHNRSIAGARFSQHVEGRGLDIQRVFSHSVGWMVKRAYSLMGQAPELIGGVGIYPWGLHLDTRETDRFVVWHGSRAVADIPRLGRGERRVT